MKGENKDGGEGRRETGEKKDGGKGRKERVKGENIDWGGEMEGETE